MDHPHEDDQGDISCRDLEKRSGTELRVGGTGNPPQYSCLENPMDGGAWWATVYGVTQSWTRLKRLSRSSSSNTHMVTKATGMDKTT